MAEEPKQHPSLMSKSSMQAMAATSGSGDLLFSEVLTKVNNAKDKAKKIEVLKRYDHPSLRAVLKGSFDPSIEWELPEGTPPFMENPAPKGSEHTMLKTEAKRLWHFIKGADTKTTKTQKETTDIRGSKSFCNCFRTREEETNVYDGRNGNAEEKYEEKVEGL